MRVIFLGTGVVYPERNRAQSSILVRTKTQDLLLDCGDGALRRIYESGNSIEGIDHLLFTHNHLDHNADFLSLVRARQEVGKNYLHIYGPVGTEQLLSNLLQAYDLQVNAQIRELGDSDQIQIGELTVVSKEAVHSIPALCFKIQAEGKNLIYSGDTEPCESLKSLCRDQVDLLIHECSFPDGFEKTAGHATPMQLGKLISNLPVKQLAITHLYPQATANLQGIIAGIAKYYSGEIIVAEDLLEVEI
ncbi:MAG: MBL fold metallo-hydrolase [Methanocellales archaeon]